MLLFGVPLSHNNLHQKWETLHLEHHCSKENKIKENRNHQESEETLEILNWYRGIRWPGKSSSNYDSHYLALSIQLLSRMGGIPEKIQHKQKSQWLVMYRLQICAWHDIYEVHSGTLQPSFISTGMLQTLQFYQHYVLLQLDVPKLLHFLNPIAFSAALHLAIVITNCFLLFTHYFFFSRNCYCQYHQMVTLRQK